MSGRRAVSLAYSELEDKAALAKKAEDAGFDIVWNSGESIPVFGAMAQTTERIQFGSGVIRAFAHDARVLAQNVADLQILSEGRFILGLGGGTKRMNINQLGKEFDHPATRLRELIQLLRLAWSTEPGKPFSFDGAYYQLKGTGTGGRGYRGPAAQPAPVYLAAVNKDMFRLAGEVCDGLCGHPIASVPFIKNVAWPYIDEGLKKAGRTRKDFDHGSWIITAISNDREQAKREAKFHMARFMATRSYAIVLDTQGLEKVRLEIQDAFFNHNEDLEKLIAAVPDDVAAAHAIYGTPDEVREQVKRYEEVLDTPTFYTASFSMSKERIKENIDLMISTLGKN